MVNQPIINTVEKYLKSIPKEFNLKKAFLFGSFARGNQNEDSDIDIALIIGNMDNFFLAQIQLMKLRRKIDLRIEPHPIKENNFNESNPFASEILRTGIEIKLSKNITTA